MLIVMCLLHSLHGGVEHYDHFAIHVFNAFTVHLGVLKLDPALPSRSIFLTKSMKSFLSLPLFASSTMEYGEEPVSSQ